MESTVSGEERVGVAVVGLGFGAEFIPLYQHHPNVGHLAIADPDPRRLAEIGERYAIAHRYPDLASVLADDRVDAVHLLSPVAHHARQAVEVLRSGRHCACAVPMATTLADLDAIIAAQTESQRNYMMMETAVYGREYLAAEQLYTTGQLGDVTLYRGFHLQNLDGFPRYWLGYPPMAYSTHALSPILALLDTSATSVQCHGSGLLDPTQWGDFDNPYPTEVALFRLRDSPAIADITLSFFQTARAYTEGFCLYGNRLGLEWPEREGGVMTMHELLSATGRRGREVRTTPFEPGDFTHVLPEPLRPYVRTGGHGGSHPYLVHEFVSSIVEGRPPRIDAAAAATWTAPGIVAHDSALRDGARLSIPDYEHERLSAP